MALVRRSTLAEPLPLEGWSFAPSAAESPLGVAASEWIPLSAPTTIAAALRSRGAWDFRRPRSFDDETWWMRCRLPSGSQPNRGPTRNILRIGGLATFADVFLDGRHVLRSENMFHEHRIELVADPPKAGGAPRSGIADGADPPKAGEASPGSSGPPRSGSTEHELAFRFSPLAPALAVRRPRPRWKTRLASHQQLRFIRTSLVGRMPGWSPPVPPIGPWRPVTLERCSNVIVEHVDLRARVVSGTGEVTVALALARIGETSIDGAVLWVGDVRENLHVSTEHTGTGLLVFRGALSIPDPRLWWPHTHGPQDRYPAKITLAIGGAQHEIDLGLVAFRTVHVDTADRGFTLYVNGVPIFCRGACWTTIDVVTLTSTPEEYARVLGSVCDAGMNMVRLSGTMFYEADAFYDACDALGILVWQDFMFANMDYPIADEGFRASVVREAEQLLRRLQAHPCLAVLCGGSEVEQQAAMFGAARDVWRGPLFDRVLPDVCASLCPDVPYWPNSPSGGALPFHVDEGVAHYYGVGAYLRPFDDARRARVRFASECLALANIPEDDVFPLFLGEGEAPFVHARWKERTSKDHGSGWDFEDVRDHYLEVLFGVDPMRLRYEDMERYLALSRVTSGEVMARVFAELRRRGSTCMGGLVWFLQDLWPGAGWGILDARGQPKSAYWFLKRALQPLALFITDEGVNGLHVHVVSEGAVDRRATLRFALYRDGEVTTAQASTALVVPPRAAIELAADGLLDTFADTARAYRFGPPGHDLAVATLTDPASGEVLAEAAFLLDFASPPPCAGLDGFLARDPDGTLRATVRTKRFAHAVTIAVPGHVPEDNYFDLAPGRARTIALRAVTKAAREPAGIAAALNLRIPARLLLGEPSPRGPSDGGSPS